MRIKKKEYLEYINLLMQANENLRNMDMLLNNQVSVIETLETCQNTAIYIGDSLEKQNMKVSEIIVPLLEEYCENLYKISQVLECYEKIIRFLDKIDKLLIDIECCMQNELKEDKKEAVFLPYKASMWDAFESIWMAANQDEEYDVYVVPIPYFSKNEAGSLVEMHYEGNEYPGYVPVIPWEEYDIEARKPDIIFIHNPYDQANLVTSVHPKFYSSELKKYTDKLVYIPYFVSSSELKEHFCVLPGVLNSNIVVLQSEHIADIYKNIFVKWVSKSKIEDEERIGIKNNNISKKLKRYVDYKYLALGSPKIEKVINTKKEDMNLPDNWQKKIIVNGKRKKVVLFNTSLDTFINTGEFYINKLEIVLNSFREKKELLLWWRPHPLFADTVKSMMPELEEHYMTIVKNYKEQDFGIYDDTADINRAIVLSDIYYGDKSSVVNLYNVTGKPIIIQDI